MQNKVVCFGEMLMDCLPTGSIPGGAPMNVAIRLKTLGTKSAMISAVGQDENGKQLLNLLRAMQVEISNVEQHSDLPTGTVQIELDEYKNATYTINQPVAWDAISVSESILYELKPISVLLFGSLSMRSKTNCSTLNDLIKIADYKVFDVNFRKPFYRLPQIFEYMKYCNLVKLNEEELIELAQFLKFSSSNLQGQLVELNLLFPNCDFCVTRGAHGALLISSGLFYEHSGFAVEVEDTIGAGDSFLAALIHQLHNDKNPKAALEYACAVGALVASKKGAVCSVEDSEVLNLIS